jgi:site-specific DNA-methyltransferase (adenine-specific)
VSDINIIQGDVLDEYKNIEEDSIDLILTDPPYGTIKGVDIPNRTNSWNKEDSEWDKTVSSNSIIRMAKNCLRPNGRLVIFCQEPYTSDLVNSANSIVGFNYKMTWLKDNFGHALMSQDAPLKYTEDILVFTNKPSDSNHVPDHELREYFSDVLDFIGKNSSQINKELGHRRAEHCFYINSTQFSLCTESTYNELIHEYSIDDMEGFEEYDRLEKIDKKEKERYRKEQEETVFNIPDYEDKNHVSNVFEYDKPTSDYHPTQKPVPLLRELINIYSNPDDKVLDLFAGSGSTGVACREEDRDCILVERKEEYVDIIRDRLDE